MSSADLELRKTAKAADARWIEKAVLSIVIPVWNEEEAIPQVLQDAQAAIASIPREEPRIAEVEVVIVDDGSTDRTREITAACRQVKLLALRHAGYGAALKSGFEAAAGDLLAFMDGDATCDPRLFARLSRPILAGEADLVNGNRLHAQSRMPRVRYFGNWVIARTMRLLSGSAVADGCSGMRVFRRSMLPLVKGLPDDLSFSPALTATTLFTAGLQMAEAPIDYRERIGRSKLSLGRDTYRFFREAFKAYRRRRPGKLNASQRGGPSGTAGGGQS